MSDRDLARKAYRPMHARLKRPFQKLLPHKPEAFVLDAGCGSGYMANWLTEQGYRVIGVDRDPSRIRRARAAFPGVRFEVCAVEEDFDSVLQGQSVDMVVSTDVIEHLYSPRTFLDNAARHLADDGCLVLSTPYHGYFKNLALSLVDGWDAHFRATRDGGHIKFFSRKTLSALLLDCGFTRLRFACSGRLPLLWKSLICRADKAPD